jgi:hypothetical protein
MADNPTPASDSTPPPAAAMTPAGSQPAATPAPKASAPAVDKEAVAREKHFKAEGYRARMNSGKKYWCITDTSTGSHIPKEQCYTEDALIGMESKSGGQLLNRDNGSKPSALSPITFPSAGGH